MRFARRLAGLALLVALCGSCDTTQPLQAETQTLQLRFQAINSKTKTFNVWDVFLDNNADLQPDMEDPQTYLWCETVPLSQDLAPVTVPWNFSVEIKILRAGQTVAETITSPEARGSTFNVAEYDNSAAQVGSIPQHVDVCTNGGVKVNCPAGTAPPSGGNRYRFRNPRRQRGPHIDIMTAVASPLFQTIRDDNPMAPLGLGQGLCSAGNPGPARVDGVPQPFSVTFEKGDTVLIQARMANQPPQQGGLTQLLADGHIPPDALSGILTVDGRAVELTGNTSGRAISFSYTSR